MDKAVHNTLCKLKVLSKIIPGQNLIINENNFKIVDCQKSNWERFLKWWLGEDRHATTNKLQNFYVELKELISCLINDNEYPALRQGAGINKINLERLQKELQNSVNGLDNMIKTYELDKTMTSELETLKENFLLELNRLNKTLERASVSPFDNPGDSGFPF